MLKIALILPAYNEEQTIGQAILDFHRELPDAKIVVVDNNSSDRTLDIANEVLSDSDIDGVVLKEPRQGKGNAVRLAFKKIDADIYVLSDADTTYPAKEVTNLIAPILAGTADMVIGDRFSGGHYSRENKRTFHNFGNSLVTNVINFFFDANLTDVMSGYRAFNSSFVKNYPILVEGFQLESDMTLHALDKRFCVQELAVHYRDRPIGSESKLSTFVDGFKVLFVIFQLLRHYRPLVFFSAVSAVLFLGGLIASYPVFQDWILYEYIYHVPLAILSSGLMIVSVLAISLGLILDSIAHHNRIKYEQDVLKEKTQSLD